MDYRITIYNDSRKILTVPLLWPIVTPHLPFPSGVCNTLVIFPLVRWHMTFLDKALGGWGSTVLVGIGVAFAAPVLLPVVGAIIRPVAKGIIKGGLFAADSLKELVAEGAEEVSDVVAEAKAEYFSASNTPSA